MRVGTVREIKNHEYRVGLTPESAHELAAHGHEVWVETGAGLGIGATDADYAAAGAAIQPDAETVFRGCEMIVSRALYSCMIARLSSEPWWAASTCSTAPLETGPVCGDPPAAAGVEAELTVEEATTFVAASSGEMTAATGGVLT